jgi:hypothetical protein
MGNTMPRRFLPGQYWIGSSVDTAKKALKNAFKDRIVKELSHDKLYELANESYNSDRITLIFDPVSRVTMTVLKG